MTVLEALVLGVLQGLTEFFPVSSSGHLVLAETFFGFESDPKSLLGFDILLHAGSLLALVLVYAKTWRDILLRNRLMLGFLVLATIPAGVIGVAFGDAIAESLHEAASVSVMLGVTGVILFLGEYVRVRRATSIGYVSAFLIGCAQAFALIPGLSRSGLTISAGTVLGMTRKDALDFSFLMAVPAIGGASVLTGLNLLSGAVTFPPVVMSTVGFLSSFGVSILTIVLLKQWVITKGFGVFAWYTILLSLFVVIALYQSTQNPLA